jgi:hypothetical protein
MGIYVNQDSPLGRLGIEALVENGFEIPDSKIKGRQMYIYEVANKININLYNMNCYINRRSSVYQKMKTILESKDKLIL